MAHDPNYAANTNYPTRGGSLWNIGAVLDILAGGKLTVADVDKTPALATAVRTARGQATTVAAVDTIATGLPLLTSVVATLDSDPTDDPFMVTASIGDQAGSPPAGSFYLKTWKNTGGTDPTPLAATTFGKKVNWDALGS
ncbi:MAG: hypothetical protein E5V60_15180 [Mesorhizobium sp.]|uniref:hypothetical protein n=1 Tax=Mesorhizobium sp. M4A.F.Ca.ET.090.04.2.1 TaxID=2496663 RepID=UPI000FCA6B2D|nr:hypothetical protein [Mesorhizobium sp. M4A.F.Ca.ET.090.04.2.1]RVC45103.1 hypothetical protein EN781_11240 [Mesorhizobium sp. M4A.F.Ca.ET.090.04.2.1]TIW65710.1 MAG: hypothetical protein E5V60_15180 [Mesorhizobium sp.]